MRGVMIIENDAVLGRRLVRALGKRGFEAVLAPSVLAAIGMLEACDRGERDAPLLCVVDIMMPSAGKWTLEETRQGLSTGLLLIETALLSRRIRVVIYTGLTGKGLVGCQDFQKTHSDLVLRVYEKASVGVTDLVHEVVKLTAQERGEHD